MIRGRKTSLLMFVLIFFIILLGFSDTTLSRAYSVRYEVFKSREKTLSFERSGQCKMRDGAAHTMMPIKEPFQTLAFEKYNDHHLTGDVPIGGKACQAACLDTNCTWVFNQGIFLHNELPFFKGVCYKGQDKTKEVPGVYNNFQRGQTPLYWESLSYWGNRQPYMNSEGVWNNTGVKTTFNNWLCEYYQFDKSDHIYLPTYPDGQPIAPAVNNEPYMYCGKPVIIDSRGRWHLQSCASGTVWYVQLLITLAITIAVFILIGLAIVIFRCARRIKKEKKFEQRFSKAMENPAHIPSQSQINASFVGSFRFEDLEY